MARFGSTYGAVLIGGLIALFLSGFVTMQTVLYYRVYRKDRVHIKLLVTAVWILDLFHSGLVLGANWQYQIIDRDYSGPIRIHWTIPACITITSVITFLVISFYIHRLWTLSSHRTYLVLPIVLLNTFRVAAGFGSSAQMASKTIWPEFTIHTGWLFAVCLTTSCALDFLVASTLVLLLRQNRTGFWRNLTIHFLPSSPSMDQVLDSITLYTIENGLLTSITTIITLVVWLSMPHNLVFLGIHYTIAKLYANSFLAMLNARKNLQERARLSASDVAPHSDSRRFSNFSAFFRKSHLNSGDSAPFASIKNAAQRTSGKRDEL
ncbi:hypothetical protein EIP91_011518 [Steccherinum ochraceum]|uniref:DUF6534 domain-containing protein n=1 Tax=Steccherinum ochraceum TaxID=92696 RepID=A0A4R0QZN1_9APHY|nr:hypothetical protein EIP91_011518 [Steccherinum ochraceum]